jgi:hypothetical protein
MASAEAVAEFGDFAENMVASRGRVESWDYKKSFQGLVEEEMSPPQLAAYLVRADQQNSDMTWLDLTKSDEFLERSKTFCEEVIKDDWHLNVGALNYHFVDLERFIANSQEAGVSESVQEAGLKLSETLDDMIVMQRGSGGEYPTCSVNVASHRDRRNKNQLFHQKTGWLDMLDHVGKAS